MRKRRPDAKPRPRLDVDAVVRAAIALLDEEGLDNLTTRRLAARLGVRSAAIYWYVRDKDELLDLVADAICAPALEPTLAVAADTSRPWRERAVTALTYYRDVLRSHRDATRLLAERPPMGPIRRKLGDAAVGAVLEAGFPAPDAAMISLLLGDYVISIVGEEMRFEALASEAARREQAQGASESGERYSNLALVAPHMAAVSTGALFEVGLEVLLDGIEHRLNKIQASA